MGLVPLFWQLSCSSKKKPNQNLFLGVLRQTRLSCFESTSVGNPGGKDYLFLAICRLGILRWNVCRWIPCSINGFDRTDAILGTIAWPSISLIHFLVELLSHAIYLTTLLSMGGPWRTVPWCISKWYCLLLGCTCNGLLSLLNLHVISNLGIVGNRPDLWNGERGSPKGSTGVYKAVCQWRSLRRHALHMRAIALCSCLLLL